MLEKQGSNYTAVYTHGNAQVRKDSEYPLHDGIGSERTVTAANQSVSGTITFEGFGQTIATAGSSANPYMFKGAWGYRNDGDAGLSHVGARYYDAQVGRFVTRDTYLDQHPYLYCEHDPVNQVDPDGHVPLLLLVAGLLILSGKGAGEPSDYNPLPDQLDAISSLPRSGPAFIIGVIRRKGPSGEDIIHKIFFPNKKSAQDAARDAGQGKPMHHPSDRGQPPHYHPVDKRGRKINDGTHYYYQGPIRRK